MFKFNELLFTILFYLSLVIVMGVTPAFAEKKDGTIKSKPYETVCDKDPKKCGSDYERDKPDKPKPAPSSIMKEPTMHKAPSGMMKDPATNETPNGMIKAPMMHYLEE